MPPINRAPFAYFGGKFRILDYLQEKLPPLKSIDCYIEPFFGSGTLFFNRDKLGEVEVINDYSSYIYNFFRVLRDDYDDFVRLLKYTPYSKETFLHARGMLSKGKNAVINSHIQIKKSDRLYMAWSIYIIYSMSIYRNGRNFSRDSIDHSKAREFKKNLERLDFCASRLRDATIENEDAIKTCTRYDSPRTFVYLDPPYLNVKNSRSMKLAYHGNDGTIKEGEEKGLHERLLEWALQCKSMVMISNYPNNLYNEALSSWNRSEIHIKTVTTRAKRGSGMVQDACEVIWTSPNVPIKKQIELF